MKTGILNRWIDIVYRGGLAVALLLASSCGTNLADDNPFLSAIPVPRDTGPELVEGTIIAAGSLTQGQHIGIEVRGEALTHVSVARLDGAGDSAVLVGGGPANMPFDFLAREAGDYFLVLAREATVEPETGQATVSLSTEVEATPARARQIIAIEFEDGYLSNPGLFDTLDGTEEERDLLASIEGVVREETLALLESIYADSPIVIAAGIEEAQSLADAGESFSVVTYRPDRVPAESQDVLDVAIAPAAVTGSACAGRFVYGQTASGGFDVGNQDRSDEASVFVGSMQGEGMECRTSVTNSVTAVSLTLAQVGAHEIGHLLGLQHVDQIDIMNRSATIAFSTRELDFSRGQLQFDFISGSELQSFVFTSLIQDPEAYFDAVFGAE